MIRHHDLNILRLTHSPSVCQTRKEITMRALLLSSVASIFVLSAWPTTSQAQAVSLLVESGKVRTEDSLLSAESRVKTANIWHSKRKSGRTHGANSTMCGETDCGDPNIRAGNPAAGGNAPARPRGAIGHPPGSPAKSQ